jgi:phage terminase large subunit GpA-like protein
MTWLVALRPPPKLTVSGWSDRERFLSSEASAEPGRWHTDRVPYMREIMDAISDSQIRRVVVAKAAQVGYTEAIGLNTVGYYIDQDATTILVILPTLELAEAWSKDRLAPMIRDTPALTGKVHEAKSRDSNNTLRQKVFPGGRLTLIGANAPSGLSARPIRIVIGDEIDRWPINSGGERKGEGDPLSLSAKRQITYWNRKTLIGSTPLHQETSVIWREYLASDQRRYFVPCPDCETPQVLRWHFVRWEKDEKGEHMPETAHYVCEHCGAIWDEARRQAAIKLGFWKAQQPTKQTAGFHVPGFVSPWMTLEDIVTEFLAARHDPQLLQVWVNTVLGEPWENAVEKIEGSSLLGRGESYTPMSIPTGVLALTLGVDVQINRLEAQLVGWGANEEAWAIDYQIFRGDPAGTEVWEDLEDYLLTKFRADDGRELLIRAACIDSGGNATASVLAFCRPRWRRRVYAIKGREGPLPIWPRSASKAKLNRGDFYLIGVDTTKDAIYGRLKIAKPGPGYIHFPVGEAFGQRYFDQLTSEQVQIRKHEGRPYRVWVLPSGRTNEALDTIVYATAARNSLRIRLSRPAGIAPTPPSDDVPPETAVEPVPQQRASGGTHSMWGDRPGGSWLGGRGRGWFRDK